MEEETTATPETSEPTQATEDAPAVRYVVGRGRLACDGRDYAPGEPFSHHDARLIADLLADGAIIYETEAKSAAETAGRIAELEQALKLANAQLAEAKVALANQQRGVSGRGR